MEEQGFVQGPRAGLSSGSHGAPSAAEDVLQYWTQTVRGEYLDVPALCLTRDQVQRLWGCEGALCDEILGELIKTHFLEQTADGRFVRASCSLRS